MTVDSRCASSTAVCVAVAALVVLLVGGCAGAPAGPPSAIPGDPGLPRRLVQNATADGAYTHLEELQDIADRNGGNRASGTSGYEQSVDYVADALRRIGYRVDTPSFTFPTFTAGAQTLTVGDGAALAVRALNYSTSTPPAGITAPLLVLPPDSPGCVPGDYGGQPVAGAVVLVRPGGCTFTQQQQIAGGAGAAALVIDSTEDVPLNISLDSPAEARIPTGSVARGDADTLDDRAGEPVTLTLVTRSEYKTSRNVIAQTATGRTDEVVLSGAHLDSVAVGPGIVDNGSGVAAQLDIALRLGPAPPVTHAVRFAWWGAEEAGLWGSNAYLQSLAPEARRDIAVLLNSDLIASPNAGYFTYDGDDSDRAGAPAGPPGSAAIERTLVAALAAAGVQARGISADYDGRTDLVPFLAAGIPVGGLFTGADGIKTSEEARLWGGQVGGLFYSCYDTRCDTLDNVDRVALARMQDALAFTVGTYAVDLGGQYGVPRRSQRTAP